MSSMTYCRHENTANDLAQVVNLWDDFDPEYADEHETRGRARIIELAHEIIEMAGDE